MTDTEKKDCDKLYGGNVRLAIISNGMAQILDKDWEIDEDHLVETLDSRMGEMVGWGHLSRKEARLVRRLWRATHGKPRLMRDGDYSWWSRFHRRIPVGFKLMGYRP